MSTIAELYNSLFATLRGLQDKESPMEIERAEAVCSVSQTIINAAKVEIDYQKITGNTVASGLLTTVLPEKPGTPTAVYGEQTAPTAHGEKTVKKIGAGATVTTHKMR